MRWLGSVEEVEVPEGFLPELYKKMEERKRRSAEVKKPELGWFHLPISFKLPVQAVAMVAIVFLVLYLTKTMPTGVYRLKDARQPPSPLSAEKKPEQVLTQKEVEKDQRIFETTPETPRPKDVDLAKAPVPREEKLEGRSPFPQGRDHGISTNRIEGGSGGEGPIPRGRKNWEGIGCEGEVHRGFETSSGNHPEDLRPRKGDPPTSRTDQTVWRRDANCRGEYVSGFPPHHLIFRV
jgi:hypothetical protein